MHIHPELTRALADFRIDEFQTGARAWRHASRDTAARIDRKPASRRRAPRPRADSV